MKHLPTRQSGFTLVEIAIVLVIIGLLLGGVLKGQEMIENSKVKNAINDMNGAAAAYNTYVDRYRRIPGDDGSALVNLTGRGGSWSTVTLFGNNNGALASATADVFTGTNESAAFWQHLKGAGLINGNPSDTGVNALPRNAFGGLTGIGNGVMGLTGIAVCLGSVTGKSARQIDVQMDDGINNTGSIRALVGAANTAPGAAAPAAATYVESSTYTICRQL